MTDILNWSNSHYFNHSHQVVGRKSSLYSVWQK